MPFDNEVSVECVLNKRLESAIREWRGPGAYAMGNIHVVDKCESLQTEIEVNEI